MLYEVGGDGDAEGNGMKVEVRYTVNRDGTIEKWYLEAEADGLIYLRKTARPKWNCCMKEFRPENVYPSYVADMRAIKEAQP